MNFFIDNNLPPAIAEALHSLSKNNGHAVTHLRHKFDASTPDEEWIQTLANEGDWVIISQDRFKKNDLEKEAFFQSGLTAFFLKRTWSDHRFWDKAYMLVRWWPRIIEQSEGVTAGANFEVPYRFSGKGKFEQFKF